ncbi:hypothetical protein DPSP01_014110 [Paraphaeosphaeria sporulosa]
MPGLVFKSKSHETVIDDAAYPAVSFPDYAEAPLSEQLEPIAVVGMGCRLPGDVSSPKQFWDMMINQKTGRNAKVPSSRFNIDAHLHPNNDRPGSFNVPGGYFINSSLKEFDPTAFGITPIEAMWMDPQQRKLLEVVWETFESAGLSLEKLDGSRTACYVGSFTSDYQQMTFKEPDFRHSYAATGVDPGLISNRISHAFNLNGPSIVVNTACSSSVYALHHACNALRNNECEGAVVGGTNLVLTVDQHMNTAKLTVLSPDSTCLTFNAEANGYGRADAVGAVYMKRLSDAIRDGDAIRGVIRSSAVNSNGKVAGLGITHPGHDGQEDVIRAAYVRGGNLDPRLTGFFECHGTGTSIGDPLEVHAVSRAMNDRRSATEAPLLIGAVKTNIGHSEAASGLSALIKAVLVVENGVIPPTRGVVNKNPKIKWDEWKVDVTTKPTPFPAHLPVKRVSVNSFGYGGTNAHMIVESAESFVSAPKYLTHVTGKKLPPRDPVEQKRPHLVVLSAHEKATLKQNIAALSKEASNYRLLDLSYTLANRRSHLPSRGFAVVSHANLEATLTEDASAFSFADKKKSPTVGFVFTGQGAQWPRMGAELIHYYPSFLRTIKHLDSTLASLPNGPSWTIEEVLQLPADQSPVNDAEYAQPLCTAIQIALVQLLGEWGITPKVTIGHSSGEIGAAYAAGLLTASEAMTAAYFRGKAVSSVKTDGAMMAVGLGAEAVQEYIQDFTGRVSIACHNSPSSVTLSGDAAALEEVKTKLGSIFARIVKTNGKAYHSHHMAPVAAIYEEYLYKAEAHIPKDVKVQRPGRMVSSVTNSLLPEDAVVDGAYWSQNLANPVLFNQAFQTIATSDEFADVDMFIEVGPHSAMAGPIKQIKGEFGYKHDYAPTLLRNTDSAAQLLKLAGELYLRDYKPLNLERVAAIEEESGLLKGQFLVDLPTYQWTYKKELWAEPRAAAEHRQPTHARHDILGSRIPGSGKPIWRNVLRIRDVPWLKGHTLGGEAIFPAAGYFSMAIEALTQLNEISDAPKDIKGFTLRDVSIKQALVTPDDDDGIEVLFTMAPSVKNETDSTTEWFDFTASSIAQNGERKDHMGGSISGITHGERPSAKAVPFLANRASGKAWNQALRDVGFDYGPGFQDMDNIRSDGSNYHASADTAIRQECGDMIGESRYVIHPGILDSCLQLIIVSIYAGRINDMACGAVPIQVDEVAVYRPTQQQLDDTAATAFSWTHKRGLRNFESGTELVAKDGTLLMRITDMRCTAYESAVPQKVTADVDSQPYQQLVWKQDIGQLQTGEGVEKLNAGALAQLALFKTPDAKILEVGSRYATSVLEQAKHSYYSILEKDSSVDVSPFTNAQVLTSDISELAESSYDVIIAPATLLQDEAASASIQTALIPGGKVFWDAESGADISTKAIEETTGEAKHVKIYYKEAATKALEDISDNFKTKGFSVTSVALQDALQNAPTKENVVVLVDLEGPILPTVTEDQFSAIQAVIDNAASITWVSSGGVINGKSPQNAMIAGLARSVRSEQAMLRFATLDFDAENSSIDRVAQVVSDIVSEQTTKPQGRLESEYSISDNEVYISRLVDITTLNDLYFGNNDAVPTPLTDDLRFKAKVSSGKVIFENDLRSEGPSAREVEVRVLVSGLTQDGTRVINGTDYPTTFSQEIGGVVTKVGSEVNNLTVGDHVAGFHLDNFASHQTVSASLVQKVSKDDLNNAVSLLTPFATAVHGLTLANVQPGESVLILQGSGTAGAAAIQITQSLGGVPYVAVESDAEAQLVVNVLNVPTEHVILTPNGSKLAQFEHLTGLSGPDVVFSSGSTNSALAREAWRFIAPFGRYVDSGRKEVLKREMTDNVPFRRGANFLSFDIFDLYKHKPAALAKTLQSLVTLYQQGSITAVGPLSTFPIADIQKAVSSLKDTFTSGRTVIEYKAGETEFALLPVRPTVSFSSEASYLLVGCLGGLGRSLTTWMTKHGARRFVFLSRSGADAKAASLLVQSLEEAGNDVLIVRGDASSREDVERAVASVDPQYPIRGVIHAAMVLRDGLFAQMPFSDWQQSTRPKVQGAQNLHDTLKDQPLDFFLMTSSVSGILGTPAQSNYAAANAYLDSLAAHRRSLGLNATSIVLPMILGIGVVAENFGIEDSLKRKGMYGIEEEELLGLFEAALNTDADHVAGGLDPLRLSKARNEETESFWAADTRFDVLANTMTAGSSGSGGSAGDSIIDSIKQAESPTAAQDLIKEHFNTKISRFLLVDLDDFEDNRSVASYGLDSMIGAELRTWIFKNYGYDMSIQQLLAPSLTVPAFAQTICGVHGIGGGAQAAAAP